MTMAMKLVRHLAPSVAPSAVSSVAGLRRFHVAAPLPEDPNPLATEEYFDQHHARELQDRYNDKNKYGYPRLRISKLDYCLGYARCPKIYKEEFMEFLQERSIIVGDDSTSYPWPSEMIPKVSKIKPIMTLVPRPILKEWYHGFSDFSLTPGFSFGVTGYYLYNNVNTQHYTSAGERVIDVAEGEAKAMHSMMVRALDEGVKKLHCFSDSKTVVNWVRGVDYMPTHPAHAQIIREIISLSEKFEDFRVEFIYREGNKIADHIADYRRTEGVNISSSNHVKSWQASYARVLIERQLQLKPYFVCRVPPPSDESEEESSI